MPYRFYGCWVWLLCCLLTGCLPQAYAAVKAHTCHIEDTAVATRDRGNPGILGIVTGPQDGTFYPFGRDIATMVQDSALGKRLKIDVRKSRGGLENICRIASAENAALGLVYADTLSFLKRWHDKDIGPIANKLRLVFPLYDSEAHIFAQKRFKTVEALRQERVIIGQQGSSTWITTYNILQLLGIEFEKEPVEASLQDGIEEVLQNKAAAFFWVGGKPVTAFRDLEERQQRNPAVAVQLRDVHFIPLDDERLLRQREYIQTTLSQKDYAWVANKTATVATKAVLINFAFSKGVPGYSASRCQAMQEVTQAIRDTVPKIKASGDTTRWHKKWQEADLGEHVSIWEYDEACTSRPTKTPTLSEKRILDVVKKYIPSR